MTLVAHLNEATSCWFIQKNINRRQSGDKNWKSESEPMHLLYRSKIWQKTISPFDITEQPQNTITSLRVIGLQPRGADILSDVWLKPNTNIQLLPRYLLTNNTSAGEILHIYQTWELDRRSQFESFRCARVGVWSKKRGKSFLFAALLFCITPNCGI